MTEQQVLAYAKANDTLKDNALHVVEQLQGQGIHTVLLTGDREEAAQYVAQQLRIPQVFSQVLPQDKAHIVQSLRVQRGVLAMIGDGINDAPALATADVGIAMGTGTDIAIATADITIVGGHITKVPTALRLSRHIMQVIKQNLFWAFIYNVLSIPIAAGVLYPFFGIVLNPMVAGAAMALSSVSVVTNSLRLRRVNLD
jgi:P-type E1-E2 ATPase